MDQQLQFLCTLGFLGAMMWGMMKFMLRDIHRDLQDIRGEIKDIRDDMKEIKEEQRIGRIRTDHLYELVCKIFNENKRA
jgi:hypothetical protein